MFYHSSRKIIYPDQNSWLSEVLIKFMKEFHNEQGLTLWEALREYVSYHCNYCAFMGKEYEGDLELYPLLSYDHNLRTAKIEKIFFVSPEAKKILTHDYLSIPGKSKNKTPFINFLNRTTNHHTDDYPALDFMITNNHMEPSLAKEILLRTSYNRKSLQRLFVFENESSGIEYKSLDVVTINFDLTILSSQNSAFLSAKRYATFEELLPENLVVSLSCKLKFDLPDVPKHLRKQQLLDVSSISN